MSGSEGKRRSARLVLGCTGIVSRARRVSISSSRQADSFSKDGDQHRFRSEGRDGTTGRGPHLRKLTPVRIIQPEADIAVWSLPRTHARPSARRGLGRVPSGYYHWSGCRAAPGWIKVGSGRVQQRVQAKAVGVPRSRGRYLLVPTRTAHQYRSAHMRYFVSFLLHMEGASADQSDHQAI
jgi:hypothetical protein